MNDGPELAPIVAALPASRPFVAPEELARRSGHRELIRLGANESAFGPPPRALEAMREALAQTAWYGDPESTDLREALAARHACAPENVCVGAGIDDLLGLTVRAYLAPGETSVATRGTYATYAYHVTGYGGVLATVPYRADGTVDLPALAACAVRCGARLVYVANPDNPSGTLASREAIDALLSALPAQALVILDEAYGDFVAAERLPAQSIDPRIVRMRTFSKAFGMAGARIGYALAARETIEAFAKIRLQFNVNRTAQIGALAALRESAFVASVVADVERGRAAYEAFARARGLHVIGSYANFSCIDAGSAARAKDMEAGLLARGVFVRIPPAPPLDRYVRVTVGTPDERERFMAAFDAAYAALPALATASP